MGRPGVGVDARQFIFPGRSLESRPLVFIGCSAYSAIRGSQEMEAWSNVQVIALVLLGVYTGRGSCVDPQVVGR